MEKERGFPFFLLNGEKNEQKIVSWTTSDFYS